MPTTMKRRARVRTCERANRVRVVASLQLHFFFPGVHSHALPSATAAAAAASAFFFPGFHSHALPAATAPPAPPASFSRCAACVFSASRTRCCNGPYFPLEIVSKNAEGSTSIGRSLSLATTQTKTERLLRVLLSSQLVHVHRRGVRDVADVHRVHARAELHDPGPAHADDRVLVLVLL